MVFTFTVQSKFRGFQSTSSENAMLYLHKGFLIMVNALHIIVWKHLQITIVNIALFCEQSLWKHILQSIQQQFSILMRFCS